MVLNEEKGAARRHVAENIISLRLKLDPSVIARYLPPPLRRTGRGS